MAYVSLKKEISLVNQFLYALFTLYKILQIFLRKFQNIQ
jgi:hypothetical protein